MSDALSIQAGQILKGRLFSEPMRVETIRAAGHAAWIAGLVGTQSERFRNVTLTPNDIGALTILDAESTFNGDGQRGCQLRIPGDHFNHCRRCFGYT